MVQSKEMHKTILHSGWHVLMKPIVFQVLEAKCTSLNWGTAEDDRAPDKELCQKFQTFI